jgi:hypothetical protein
MGMAQWAMRRISRLDEMLSDGRMELIGGAKGDVEANCPRDFRLGVRGPDSSEATPEPIDVSDPANARKGDTDSMHRAILPSLVFWGQ